MIADRTALAAERDLSLEDQPDPHLPPALADPNMTGQVIANLIANAIYYTPPGGSVTLTTTVRRREDAICVTFTVQDTSPGISAEDMSHLFEPFFRGEAAQTTGTPGAGLGLAICEEIVDKMNGFVTVDSEPGKGAAFTVWLRPAERET